MKLRASIGVLLATAFLSFAGTPAFVRKANFDDQRTYQWDLAIPALSTPDLVFSTYQGSATFDCSGYSAYFSYGKNESATGIYVLAGTVAGNKITFTSATNNFPKVVDKWYSALSIISTNKRIGYARGWLNIIRSPELDTGTVSNISFPPFFLPSDTNLSAILSTHMSETNTSHGILRFDTELTNINAKLIIISNNAEALLVLHADDLGAHGVTNYLPLAGGTLTGDLDLSTNALVNVGSLIGRVYINGGYTYSDLYFQDPYRVLSCSGYLRTWDENADVTLFSYHALNLTATWDLWLTAGTNRKVCLNSDIDMGGHGFTNVAMNSLYFTNGVVPFSKDNWESTYSNAASALQSGATLPYTSITNVPTSWTNDGTTIVEVDANFSVSSVTNGNATTYTIGVKSGGVAWEVVNVGGTNRAQFTWLGTNWYFPMAP